MRRGHRPLRLHGLLTARLALLGAQILLGRAVNVWVTLPARHPGAKAQNYFGGLPRGIPWALWHGGPPLTAHVALGIILWGLSIGILVGAWRTGPRTVGLWTLVAWSGITGAGFNGRSFVNYGHGVSSFLMAVGWLVPAVGYAAAMSAPGPVRTWRLAAGLEPSTATPRLMRNEPAADCEKGLGSGLPLLADPRPYIGRRGVGVPCGLHA